MVNLNFTEDQPGRSPHRTRKNTKESSLVSKSSGLFQTNALTEIIVIQKY